MDDERRAGAMLAYLGYVMDHASDRSNNVLERATLQCARAACQIFARKIAAGTIADEHWHFLAAIQAPPVPEEKAKPKHTPFKPYSSDYQSWKDELVYRDAAEGE